MKRPVPMLQLLLITPFGAGPLLMAQADTPPAPIDVSDGFPWGIHLILIPLVLLFGIFIGWSLRDRKGFAPPPSAFDKT